MFTEDMTPFFDTDVGFAQSATVAGLSVAVIFENGHSLGDVGMLGMASAQPALVLRTADVPADPVGNAVVVNGGTYLVAAHEPDGTGLSRLLLEASA